MIEALRTAFFLLFGVAAGVADRQRLRIPRWCSWGGAAILLLLGDPRAQLPVVLYALFAFGLCRLAMPDRLGGGDLALAVMIAAYLRLDQWTEAVIGGCILLLLLSRSSPRRVELAPLQSPFAPYLVSAAAFRGSLGPIRDAVQLILGALLLFLPASVAPEEVAPPQLVEMEFREQPIRDILLALGGTTGRSIVPDRTVTGTASYFFSEVPFQPSLESFAEAYGLYLLPRESGITIVSRIRVTPGEGDSYTLDVEDAPLPTVLQRLSMAAGVPIRGGLLGGERVSFHGGPLPLPQLLRALFGHRPEVTVKERHGYILIDREEEERDYRGSPAAAAGRSRPFADPAAEAELGELIFTTTGVHIYRDSRGRYSLFLQDPSLSEVIDALYTAEGKSYCYRGNELASPGRIALRSATFGDAVDLLLREGDAKAIQRHGYTEIVPVAGSEATPVDLSVPLTRWAPEAMARVISGFAEGEASSVPDPGAGRLFISGDPEAAGRLAALVTDIDRRELETTPLESVELRESGAAAFIDRLPERFRQFTLVPTPDDATVVVAAPEAVVREIRRFAQLYDRQERPAFYPLAALGAEAFVNRFGNRAGMPDMRAAPDDRGVLAWGSKGEIENLETLLTEMDQPRRQIRYDLLIVQRQHREGRSYDLETEVTGPNAPGRVVSLTGVFDQLLSLRFDAVALLGYRLAAAISRGLSERSARLLADTTLYGLDGSEVTFNNTETYRYRDLAYDEDEKEILPTGVTREITSGIRLAVTGGVVEGRQVRMKITAEYSKQGVETSEGGEPPATSEKQVETTVRTGVGEPIILAGLLEREESEQRRPVPILSRLPLLRRLFRPGRKEQEVTELVIYLVPHIERGGDDGFRGVVRELLETLTEGGA